MQNKVKEFNITRQAHFKPMTPYARLLDIISEMGELSKEYLKHSKYGSAEFQMHEDFILEYGDVLYSYLSLADELGLDANFALDKVITKYKSRLENYGSMGSKKEN